MNRGPRSLHVLFALLTLLVLSLGPFASATEPPYVDEHAEHSAAADPSGLGAAEASAAASRFTGEMSASASVREDAPVGVFLPYIQGLPLYRAGSSFARARSGVTLAVQDATGSVDIRTTVANLRSDITWDGRAVPRLGCGNLDCIHNVSVQGLLVLWAGFSCHRNCVGGPSVGRYVRYPLSNWFFDPPTLTIGTALAVPDGEEGTVTATVSFEMDASAIGMGSASASASGRVSDISITPSS